MNYLMAAIDNNNQNDIVEYLLKNVYTDNDSRKAALNFTDDKGRTPFWIACSKNYLECAKKFITPENVYMRDKDGVTPMLHAITNGLNKIVNFLDDNKVHIIQEDLITAVKRGNIAIVCQLLLTQIRRYNLKDVDELEKRKILNSEIIDEWLNICDKCEMSGLFAFLTKLKDYGLNGQKNKFSYIKALLTMNSDNTKYDVDSKYQMMRKGILYYIKNVLVFFFLYGVYTYVCIFYNTVQ